MSLQARFAALLSLLGAAVVVNLAVSVWSVGLLDREQRWANEQIGVVLGPLHRINRSVWDQAGALGSPGIGAFGPAETAFASNGSQPSPTPDRERFEALNAEAVEDIEELDESASAAQRTGVTTIRNLRVNATRNLRQRLHQARDAAREWFDQAAAAQPGAVGSEQAAALTATRQAAVRELFELHELVERLEARLIDDAQFAQPHVRNVRRRLVYTVAASVAVVVLLLVLAGRLFRRWVLLKADRLGFAAERLRAGHFEHRIPVDGGDELDHVASRVNEMASTIVSMQAERIERERLAAIGEMARRVAHNIRNPLAGIRSLAELSSLESPSGSPVVEHQQRIIRTVDRFGSWLTELLSVSTPLEVRPREEPVRVWLEGLVEALRPMAEDRGVELELDLAGAPASATVDLRHLEQAVTAVITNAIEVSPRSGRVTVRTDNGGGLWRIAVEDEGPGLSPEAKQKLFRPYFTTKMGGTGIGLALAHRVVREHGGRIGAENRPSDRPRPAESGLGAAFWIELPLVRADEPARISQE